MERRGLGWRTGVTNELSARLCLEVSADRIVGLRACSSELEARCLEALWSLKYSIPALPFKRPKRMTVVGDRLDRLFGELETEHGAKQLAADLGVALDAHRCAVDGVHRRAYARVKVILTMCNQRQRPKNRGRPPKNSEIVHVVSLETSKPAVLRKLRAAGVPLRKTKRGWLVRAMGSSLQDVGAQAERLRDLTDGILEVRFVVGTINARQKAALMMPAGNVLPGHCLPVARGNRVVYERVVRVSEEWRASTIYDLEVERTHNFIANGVVVHNSIYKFRGAAISNVLGFVNVYPDARQVVLTENYRSPQPLLDAAYRLIVNNNPDRLEVTSGISKRLQSVQGGGVGPMHLHFESGSQEADEVARMIHDRVAAGAWRYGEVAILVRSNNDADPHLRALNLRNVPWTFSGNAGLYGRPEVRLLIAFLRSVAHPDDSVSVHYLASSDLYQVPIVDLTRCATYADRRHRWLFDVFRQVGVLPELKAEIGEEGQRAIRRLVNDLTRYMELGREMPSGELLYQFLADSGWLARMSQAATARDEAEVQNISKFFRRIQDAGKVLRYDNVREFVAYLDALIDAGDDPAVTEADTETPAVRILTVHKAKGLEFPVVFMVGLAQNKFPWPRRREGLELPVELIKEVLPSGDFHAQEERRLFYVGMTRARRELYLTSARDYGGSRERKVSQFVLEALDLPKDAAKPFRARAVEEIERFAPPAETDRLELAPIPPDEELRISHKQIEEYKSCPLKYRYSYILRVPQPRHHALVYGATIHEVVEFYLRRRAAGNYTSIDALLAEYDTKWLNQGFLSWEHQEARKAAGRETLTRFWNQEEAEGARPSFVEKDFGFSLGADRVTGRFDRVDEELLGAVVVDYKTGEVATTRIADKRAHDSLQLKIYALAWREMSGALPERVELRFLESHTVGRHTPTEADIAEATKAVKDA